MQDRLKMLEGIRDAILSKEWEVAEPACKAVIALCAEDAIEMLVPLLQSELAYLRIRAAMALRRIADQRAFLPLVEAIRSPNSAGMRGTLVYALQTYDCSDQFTFLFDLVLNDIYEVQCMAINILEDQSLRASEEEIRDATQRLSEFARTMKGEEGVEERVQILSRVLANLDRD